MRWFLPGLLAVAAVFLVFWYGAPVRAGECGWITWYAATGNKTACGDFYDGTQMIAAHRTLPCGHPLKVTDRKTGKTVHVRVRDRGPAVWTGNSLDLSVAAAKRLGIIQRGRVRGCW